MVGSNRRTVFVSVATIGRYAGWSKRFLIITFISLLLLCSCTKKDTTRRRIIPIIITPFHGFNNTPGLYGWSFSGDTITAYPVVDIGPFPGNRWSLVLKANQSGGEYVHYDLDSLDEGVYEVKVYTRSLSGNSSAVQGKIQLLSEGKRSEFSTGVDTMWQQFTFIDTIKAGKTIIQLYGGFSQDTNTKVLFNEVSVFKVVY